MGIQKYRSKTVAFFVALSFILLNCGANLHAQTPSGEALVSRFPLVDEAPISLPAELGVIQETYQGHSNQTVIYLQDAHTHPEAQRSIQKIIDYFQRRHGLQLVTVEGGEGRLDPLLFRAYPGRKNLESVFRDYLDKGELSGVAAAAVLNERPAEYYGIEDRKLYEEGMLAYLAADRKIPETLEKLDRLQGDLDRKKERLYSPELLKLDRAIKEFEAEKVRLAEFLAFLAGYEGGVPSVIASERSERSNLKGYPHLFALIKEIETEGSDSKAVTAEIRSLTHELKPLLKDKSELMSFNENEQAYQTGRLSAHAFAHFLLEMAGQLYRHLGSGGLSLRYLKANYPALLKATEHFPLLKKMQAPVFFEELESYLAELKSRLFPSEAAERLDALDQRLARMRSLVRMELTRKDWEALKRDIAVNHRLSAEPSLDDFVAFYRIAEAREKVFVEKIQKLLEKGDREILFLSGGFHTEGVTEAFRKQGLSYVLITPRITKSPEEGLYQKMMRGEVSWKNYFKVRNGWVNLYEAFAEATADRLARRPAEGERRKILRLWRDDVIRKLSGERRIEQSRAYTRFIERAALETVSPEELTRLQSLWRARLDRFLTGLKDLVTQNRLTEQNLLRLFAKPASMPAAVLPLFPTSRLPIALDRITHPRSELRSDEIKEGRPRGVDWQTFIEGEIKRSPPWKDDPAYQGTWKQAALGGTLGVTDLLMDQIVKLLEGNGMLTKERRLLPGRVGLVLGFGRSANELSEAKHWFNLEVVHGVEWVDGRVEDAAKGFANLGLSPRNFRLHHESMEELKDTIADESVDFVYARAISYDFKGASRKLGLEILRILKPGGIFYTDDSSPELREALREHGELLGGPDISGMPGFTIFKKPDHEQSSRAEVRSGVVHLAAVRRGSRQGGRGILPNRHENESERSLRQRRRELEERISVLKDRIVQWEEDRGLLLKRIYDSTSPEQRATVLNNHQEWGDINQILIWKRRDLKALQRELENPSTSSRAEPASPRGLRRAEVRGEASTKLERSRAEVRKRNISGFGDAAGGNPSKEVLERRRSESKWRQPESSVYPSFPGGVNKDSNPDTQNAQRGKGETKIGRQLLKKRTREPDRKNRLSHISKVLADKFLRGLIKGNHTWFPLRFPASSFRSGSIGKNSKEVNIDFHKKHNPFPTPFRAEVRGEKTAEERIRRLYSWFDQTESYKEMKRVLKQHPKVKIFGGANQVSVYSSESALPIMTSPSETLRQYLMQDQGLEGGLSIKEMERLSGEVLGEEIETLLTVFTTVSFKEAMEFIENFSVRPPTEAEMKFFEHLKRYVDDSTQVSQEMAYQAAIYHLAGRDGSYAPLLDYVNHLLENRGKNPRIHSSSPSQAVQSFDEVREIKIWGVKEGLATHVSRIQVRLQNRPPVYFAMNVAQDLHGSADTLRDAHRVLEEDYEWDPRYIMEPLGLGAGKAKRWGERVVSIPISVGEWLEEFEELHLEPESDTRFEIWREQGKRKEIVDREGSNQIWSQIAYLRTLYSRKTADGVILARGVVLAGDYVGRRGKDGRWEVMQVWPRRKKNERYPDPAAIILNGLLLQELDFLKPNPDVPALIFWSRFDLALGSVLAALEDQAAGPKRNSLEPIARETLNLLKGAQQALHDMGADPQNKIPGFINYPEERKGALQLWLELAEETLKRFTETIEKGNRGEALESRQTPTLEWFEAVGHPFSVDLRFGAGRLTLSQRESVERELGMQMVDSVPSMAQKHGLDVPSLKLDWAIRLGLESLFHPRSPQQGKWTYENLTASLSKRLGRPVSVDEIQEIDFWAPKAGGVMLVNRAVVKLKGEDTPEFLVVDVPKDLGPSSERVKREYEILKRWHERLPDRVMEPYKLITLRLRNSRFPQKTFPLHIMIGRWFEGYLETHIVPDGGSFRVQVIREWGDREGRGLNAVVLDSEPSDEFWAEIARMRTVLSDFENGTVTSGLFAINDGAFIAGLDGSNQLIRDNRGRPDIKIISVSELLPYPEEVFPLLLTTDQAMYHRDATRPEAGRLVLWNRPEKSFEAFIQGYIDQVGEGLSGKDRDEAVRKRREEALRILEKTRQLKPLQEGGIQMRNGTRVFFAHPQIAGGEVFQPLLERALAILPSFIEAQRRILKSGMRSGEIDIRAGDIFRHSKSQKIFIVTEVVQGPLTAKIQDGETEETRTLDRNSIVQFLAEHTITSKARRAEVRNVEAANSLTTTRREKRARPERNRTGFGSIVGKLSFKEEEYRDQLISRLHAQGLSGQEVRDLANALVRFKEDSLGQRASLFAEGEGIKNILPSGEFDLSTFVERLRKERQAHSEELNPNGKPLFTDREIHELLFKSLIPVSWVHALRREGLSKHNLLRAFASWADPLGTWQKKKTLRDDLKKSGFSDSEATIAVMNWEHPQTTWKRLRIIRDQLASHPQNKLTPKEATMIVITWGDRALEIWNKRRRIRDQFMRLGLGKSNSNILALRSHPAEMLRAVNKTAGNLTRAGIRKFKENFRFLLQRSHGVVRRWLKDSSDWPNRKINKLLRPLGDYQNRYGRSQRSRAEVRTAEGGMEGKMGPQRFPRHLRPPLWVPPVISDFVTGTDGMRGSRPVSPARWLMEMKLMSEFSTLRQKLFNGIVERLGLDESEWTELIRVINLEFDELLQGMAEDHRSLRNAGWEAGMSRRDISVSVRNLDEIKGLVFLGLHRQAQSLIEKYGSESLDGAVDTLRDEIAGKAPIVNFILSFWEPASLIRLKIKSPEQFKLHLRQISEVLDWEFQQIKAREEKWIQSNYLVRLEGGTALFKFLNQFMNRLNRLGHSDEGIDRALEGFEDNLFPRSEARSTSEETDSDSAYFEKLTGRWDPFWRKSSGRENEGAFAGSYPPQVQEWVLGRIAPWAAHHGAGSFVDLGSGIDLHLLRIIQKQFPAYSLHALDVVEPSLIPPGFQNGIPYWRSLMERTPFETGMFDGVLSTFAAEYGRLEEISREILRILKPAGLGLLVIHHPGSGIVVERERDDQRIRQAIPLLQGALSLLQRVDFNLLEGLETEAKRNAVLFHRLQGLFESLREIQRSPQPEAIEGLKKSLQESLEAGPLTLWGHEQLLENISRFKVPRDVEEFFSRFGFLAQATLLRWPRTPFPGLAYGVVLIPAAAAHAFRAEASRSEARTVVDDLDSGKIVQIGNRLPSYVFKAGPKRLVMLSMERLNHIRKEHQPAPPGKDGFEKNADIPDLIKKAFQKAAESAVSANRFTVDLEEPIGTQTDREGASYPSTKMTVAQVVLKRSGSSGRGDRRNPRDWKAAQEVFEAFGSEMPRDQKIHFVLTAFPGEERKRRGSHSMQERSARLLRRQILSSKSSSPRSEVRSQSTSKEESLIAEDSAVARLFAGIGFDLRVPRSAMPRGREGKDVFRVHWVMLPDEARARLHQISRLTSRPKGGKAELYLFQPLPGYSPILSRLKGSKDTPLFILFKGEQPLFLVVSHLSWDQLDYTHQKDYLRTANVGANVARKEVFALAYLVEAAEKTEMTESKLRVIQEAGKFLSHWLGTRANHSLSVMTRGDLFNRFSTEFGPQNRVYIFPGAFDYTSISSQIFLSGIRPEPGDSVLDLGTGTLIGAVKAAEVQLQAGQENPDSVGEIWAVDQDPLAVQNALFNRGRLPQEVASKIEVRQSDLFQNIPPDKRFNRIYFNLPVETEGAKNPADSRLAVDPKVSDPGSKLLERLLKESKPFLKPGGTLEVSQGDLPHFWRRVYENGWLPTVVEGYQVSRGMHQRAQMEKGLPDSIRVTLVPSSATEPTPITDQWRAIEKLHDKLLSQPGLSDEEMAALQEMEQHLRGEVADVNSFLLHKAVRSFQEWGRGNFEFEYPIGFTKLERRAEVREEGGVELKVKSEKEKEERKKVQGERGEVAEADIEGLRGADPFKFDGLKSRLVGKAPTGVENFDSGDPSGRIKVYGDSFSNVFRDNSRFLEPDVERIHLWIVSNPHRLISFASEIIHVNRDYDNLGLFLGKYGPDLFGLVMLPVPLFFVGIILLTLQPPELGRLPISTSDRLKYLGFARAPKGKLPSGVVADKNGFPRMGGHGGEVNPTLLQSQSEFNLYRTPRRAEVRGEGKDSLADLRNFARIVYIAEEKKEPDKRGLTLFMRSRKNYPFPDSRDLAVAAGLSRTSSSRIRNVAKVHYGGMANLQEKLGYPIKVKEGARSLKRRKNVVRKIFEAVRKREPQDEEELRRFEQAAKGKKRPPAVFQMGEDVYRAIRIHHGGADKFFQSLGYGPKKSLGSWQNFLEALFKDLHGRNPSPKELREFRKKKSRNRVLKKADLSSRVFNAAQKYYGGITGVAGRLGFKLSKSYEGRSLEDWGNYARALYRFLYGRNPSERAWKRFIDPAVKKKGRLPRYEDIPSALRKALRHHGGIGKAAASLGFNDQGPNRTRMRYWPNLFERLERLWREEGYAGLWEMVEKSRTTRRLRKAIESDYPGGLAGVKRRFLYEMGDRAVLIAEELLGERAFEELEFLKGAYDELVKKERPLPLSEAARTQVDQMILRAFEEKMEIDDLLERYRLSFNGRRNYPTPGEVDQMVQDAVLNGNFSNHLNAAADQKGGLQRLTAHQRLARVLELARESEATRAALKHAFEGLEPAGREGLLRRFVKRTSIGDLILGIAGISLPPDDLESRVSQLPARRIIFVDPRQALRLADKAQIRSEARQKRTERYLEAFQGGRTSWSQFPSPERVRLIRVAADELGKPPGEMNTRDFARRIQSLASPKYPYGKMLAGLLGHYRKPGEPVSVALKRLKKRLLGINDSLPQKRVSFRIGLGALMRNESLSLQRIPKKAQRRAVELIAGKMGKTPGQLRTRDVRKSSTLRRLVNHYWKKEEGELAALKRMKKTLGISHEPTGNDIFYVWKEKYSDWDQVKEILGLNGPLPLNEEQLIKISEEERKSRGTGEKWGFKAFQEALFTEVRRGNAAARSASLILHQGLIWMVAKKVWRISKNFGLPKGIAFEDLISVGKIVLARAVEKFSEKKRPYLFSSYAYGYLNAAMVRLVKRERKREEKFREILHEPLNGTDGATRASFIDEERRMIWRGRKNASLEPSDLVDLRPAVVTALKDAGFSERDIRIFFARIAGQRRDEIGLEHHISGVRVGQIHQKALGVVQRALADGVNDGASYRNRAEVRSASPAVLDGGLRRTWNMVWEGPGEAKGQENRQVTGDASGSSVREESTRSSPESGKLPIPWQTSYASSLIRTSARAIPAMRSIGVTILSVILSPIPVILSKIPPIAIAMTKVWNSVRQVLERASNLFSVQKERFMIAGNISIISIIVNDELIPFRELVPLFHRAEVREPSQAGVPVQQRKDLDRLFEILDRNYFQEGAFQERISKTLRDLPRIESQFPDESGHPDSPNWSESIAFHEKETAPEILEALKSRRLNGEDLTGLWSQMVVGFQIDYFRQVHSWFKVPLESQGERKAELIAEMGYFRTLTALLLALQTDLANGRGVDLAKEILLKLHQKIVEADQRGTNLFTRAAQTLPEMELIVTSLYAHSPTSAEQLLLIGLAEEKWPEPLRSEMLALKLIHKVNHLEMISTISDKPPIKLYEELEDLLMLSDNGIDFRELKAKFEPVLTNSGKGDRLAQQAVGMVLLFSPVLFLVPKKNRPTFFNGLFGNLYLDPEYYLAHYRQGLKKGFEALQRLGPIEDLGVHEVMNYFLAINLLHYYHTVWQAGMPKPTMRDVFLRTQTWKDWQATEFAENRRIFFDASDTYRGNKEKIRLRRQNQFKRLVSMVPKDFKRSEARREVREEGEKGKGARHFSLEGIVRDVMEERRPGRAEVRRFLGDLQGKGKTWSEIEKMIREAAGRLFTNPPPSLAIALLEERLPLRTQISPRGEIYENGLKRGVRGLQPAEASPVGSFARNLVESTQNYRTSA